MHLGQLAPGADPPSPARPAPPAAPALRPGWPPPRSRRRARSPAWPAAPGFPPPAAIPVSRKRSGLRRDDVGRLRPDRAGRSQHDDVPAVAGAARGFHPAILHRRTCRLHPVSTVREVSPLLPAQELALPPGITPSWLGLTAAQQPDWPDPARVQQVLAELAGAAAAGLRRRVRPAPRPAGRGQPRRGVRAAGRRLRRDVRRRQGRRRPRQAADNPADGSRAHLRRQRPGRQDRQAGRPVRQAQVRGRPRPGTASSCPPTAATRSTGSSSPRPPAPTTRTGCSGPTTAPR